MRVCAIALLCVATGVLIQRMNREIALAVRALGGVMIFALLAVSVGDMVGEIREVGVGAEYADLAVRALGVAVLSHICASVCRDCGESGLASGVELAGKLEILALCMPLIVKILGYASALLELDG